MEEPTQLKQTSLASLGVVEAGDSLPCRHAWPWLPVLQGTGGGGHPRRPSLRGDASVRPLSVSPPVVWLLRAPWPLRVAVIPLGTRGGALSRLRTRELLWAEQELRGPLTPTSLLFSTKRIPLHGSREMGCGVYAKQPAERSGTCCEKGVKSVWHHGNQRVLSVENNSKYGGEWQGRNVFSRNFCPGVGVAKPQSSALQTLGDMFFHTGGSGCWVPW